MIERLTLDERINRIHETVTRLALVRSFERDAEDETKTDYERELSRKTAVHMRLNDFTRSNVPSARPKSDALILLDIELDARYAKLEALP